MHQHWYRVSTVLVYLKCSDANNRYQTVLVTKKHWQRSKKRAGWIYQRRVSIYLINRLSNKLNIYT